MAKGSGTNRATSWRDVSKVSSNERVDFVVRHLKADYGEPDNEAILAFDALSDSEKDTVLAKTNFTGIVYNDQFYGSEGTLSIAENVGKDRIFSMVDDYAYYNKPDDDSTFTIGYSDGTIRNYDSFSNQTRRAVKRTGAEWVMGGGLASGSYWASEKGLKMMAEYADFSIWKNGKKVGK